MQSWGRTVEKLELDATEKENEARSSSSFDSQEGRIMSAGATWGEGDRSESLSGTKFRETFLFFKEDVMTMSCPGSSGTTSIGMGRKAKKRATGKCHEQADRAVCVARLLGRGWFLEFLIARPGPAQENPGCQC